jgi:hypothetical protein
MNTDIWNNERVVGITGYTIGDIKDCLYDMAEFIQTNLSPNRLENFDIETVKTLEPFNDIPEKLGLNLKDLQ